MSGGSTVIVGLNGALQKRFLLPQSTSLVPGNVHRATDAQVGVGGKGQDVAIALSCLMSKNSKSNSVKLAQFVGSGAEGDLVYRLLTERLGDDAMTLTVRSRSHMRTCTTIVASDVSTELVEPSGVITSEEQAELMEKLGSLTMSSSTTLVPTSLCIMGTMPPGCPEDLYAAVYQKIFVNQYGPNKQLCLIDSVVGLDPLLKVISAAAASAHPGWDVDTILKVNASELCRMAVQNPSGTINEADGIGLDELVDGVTGFLNKHSPFALTALSGLAITNGKHPAHYVAIDEETTSIQVFQLPVADLDSTGITTVYPIGAGDTVAAGTLSAWSYLAESDSRITDEEYSSSSAGLDEKIQIALSESSREEAEGLTATLAGSVSSCCSRQVHRMLTGFAFGLACGSASCLQAQNSMLEVDDALRLFRNRKPPVWLRTIPITT